MTLFLALPSPVAAMAFSSQPLEFCGKSALGLQNLQSPLRDLLIVKL
jgi:hypothetical protein